MKRRKQWFTGRGRQAVLAVLALSAVGLGVVFWPGSQESTELPDEDVQPASPATTWPLTGVAIDVLPPRPALLVKVSNSPEARPQTGLAEADVVFEELTEAGITRFAAVFHSQLPEVVGPVRSARPVDVQLMAGFGHPGFAYSGAREEVRELLARAPAAPITEGVPAFFRDDGRYASHPFAPHDLFLTVDAALDSVTERGARPLGDIGWEFDDEPPQPAGAESAGAGGSLDIVMSSASTTTWDYDPADGVYRREQNGQATEVTGDARIAAANVVVLDVRHYVGASGYPETDVLGEGPGVVLRDGERYRITWSKPSATDPFALHLPGQAEPFPLKPGPTWIHLPDELPG